MPPTSGSKAEMKKVLDVSFCNAFQKKTDGSSKSASSYVSSVGALAGCPSVCVAQTANSDYWRQGRILQPDHHADLEHTMQRP